MLAFSRSFDAAQTRLGHALDPAVEEPTAADHVTAANSIYAEALAASVPSRDFDGAGEHDLMALLTHEFAGVLRSAESGMNMSTNQAFTWLEARERDRLTRQTATRAQEFVTRARARPVRQLPENVDGLGPAPAALERLNVPEVDGDVAVAGPDSEGGASGAE